MPRHHAIGIAGGLCAVMLWAEVSIATDPPDFDCDVVTAESQIAIIDTVVARIVFVGFPYEGAARQDLPNWANTLRAELETFFNEMSFGQHVLDIEIATRSDEPTKAWIADLPACSYSHYSSLNQEIMQKVHDDDPLGTPWAGVEQVFMIHYTCVWGPTLGCGTPGIAGLGVSGIPNFTGGGTSQHMFEWRLHRMAANQQSTRFAAVRMVRVGSCTRVRPSRARR